MLRQVRHVTYWLTLIVIVLMPLILTEIYLRYLGLGNPILYYTNSSYRFAPLPDQRKQRLAGAWVTIDSRGLRAVRPWDAETEFRILFIGDSVTWGGTSIDDKDTFAHLTCVSLENRLGASFTCGNAGVNAYGIDNMTARLKYKNFNNEDAIVTTVIPPDAIRGLTDLKSQYFFSSSPFGPFPAIWEAGTFVLFKFVNWLRHHSETYIDKDDLSTAENSLENLFHSLKEKESKGKLVLVVLSPISEELGDKESIFTKTMLQLLRKYKLHFLNMNPVVTRNYSENIFSDDRHLEYDGHQLYAKAISDELMKYLEQLSKKKGRRR